MDTVAYFEIQASDPARCIDFYHSVFGWTFVREEAGNHEYYRIETPGMHGGLMRRPADIPPMECGTNAFTCSMMVADFDKMAEMILAQGGVVALPKFAIPGRCWQGYFLDPDHNVFGLFQVDEEAK